MVFPRNMDRAGYSAKKCCCDDNRLCYKLYECEESTTCPSDGVYVTFPAWDYIETVMQYLPPDGFPVVLQWAEGCCVYADSTTNSESNQYLLSDVLAMSNSGVIWSLTEPAGQGKFIQLMNKIWDCEECYVAPTGACCVTAGRGTNCFSNQTQAQCDALNGKWFGADSVCTGDDAVDCSDDDPSCGEKRGICFCREVGGEWSGTLCNDDDDTCSSTYSATLSLPSVYLQSQSGGCGTLPFPDECVVHNPDICECQDGGICDGEWMPSLSATTTLTKSTTFGTTSYSSPDETGDHPENERPDGEYAFGGYLNLAPLRCVYFDEESGCFCDRTHRIKSWWYGFHATTEIQNPSQWCEQCQDVLFPSDPEYLFCCPEPPCNVWRITLDLRVMLENIKEPENNWLERGMLFHGYSAYVRTSGCSCPAGLVTSNVHWNNIDDSIIAPQNPNYPFSGYGGGRYKKRCFPLGCDHWTEYGGYWLIDGLDFIRGIHWSIT